jgi:hypothetical protein
MRATVSHRNSNIKVAILGRNFSATLQRVAGRQQSSPRNGLAAQRAAGGFGHFLDDQGADRVNLGVFHRAIHGLQTHRDGQ